MRRMNAGQVERAIWIDFEGTTTEAPSMLGVLWMPSGESSPRLTQYVFDEGLRLAVEGTAAQFAHEIVMADRMTTLRDLLAQSDETHRHLASWSLHDYNEIVEKLGPIAVRFRNAKVTAKRWRAGRTQLSPDLPVVEFPHQELQRYLEFIGYHVPLEVQGDAATNIRNVRERSAGKSSWEDVSDGGKEAWRRLIEHNIHDLLGMHRVCRIATGFETDFA